MRNRTWRLLMFGLVAVVCSFTLTLFALPPATVTGYNLFELDGNVIDDPAGAPDDWGALYSGGGSAYTWTGIQPDMHVGTPPDDTAFFNNKTKDTEFIQTFWTWKRTTVPDKDDLNNAYAAAYVAPNNHTIITFGADRFSAGNGTAFLGFWFFQDKVAPKPASTAFDGEHVSGDVLVLVNFTGGGSHPAIQVLKWVVAGDAGFPGDVAEHLRVLYSDADALCGTEAGPACAVTNGAGVTVPWQAAYKNVGYTYNLPALAFFEGGVDLTALFPEGQPCFTSFLAETRSSDSVTADLKDFVAGEFSLCGIGISKVCGSYKGMGSYLTFTNYITVENTGMGALYNVLVTDTYQASASTTETRYFAGTGGCGTLANCTEMADLVKLSPGDEVTIEEKFDTTLLEPTDTAYADAAPSATSDRTVSAGPAPKKCTGQVSALVSVVKKCYETQTEKAVTLVEEGGILKVQVKVWGTITSNSEGTNIVVTGISDVPAATIGLPTLPVTLKPGESVDYGPFTYFPSKVNLTACETGFTCFTDEVTVTYHAILGDTTNKTAKASADCPLCVPGCLGNNSCQPILSATIRR